MNYNDLSLGQIYNHFPLNVEITSKAGLCRNIQNITNHSTNYENVFPRCYDCANKDQIIDFIKDFERTKILNLIKRHVNYYLKYHKK